MTFFEIVYFLKNMGAYILIKFLCELWIQRLRNSSESRDKMRDSRHTLAKLQGDREISINT